MSYDPSAQQPDEPYTQYPDSSPPQPTSGGYYQQQPGYDPYGQPGYQQPGYDPYANAAYQQPVAGYLGPQPELPQGMAITSLVLGIASLPLTFCCYIGIIPAILSIIFGGIGIAQVNRGEAKGKGMALAGLILGIATFVILILLLVLYLSIGFATGFNTTDVGTY